MRKAILSFFAMGLLATLTHAAPVFDQWSGTGPFATGQGNRVISALAVSADGTIAYAGTGSGTVLRYAYSDAAPEAFSFTAQTGVALSTGVTSNDITVTGINTGAAISIAGGSYSVNGGNYTAVSGTVSNGDTVTVRLTSSANFSTTSLATLTIGAQSAAFQVTTQDRVTSYAAPSGPGTGSTTASFTGGGTHCSLATAAYATPTTSPAGVFLPYGTFSFTTTQCDAGATLNFTITYPQPLPAGAKYYKFGPEFGGSATPHWYELPGAVVSGSQVTFSITDNGVGDSNPAPGYITDPGGVGVPSSSVTSVPTLGELALMLLAGLLGLAGMRAEARGRCLVHRKR